MNLLALNLNRFLFLKRDVNHLFNCIRFASGCFDDKTKCPKSKTIKSPCSDNKPQKHPLKVPKKEVYKSMWANPMCDPKVAKCPPVRFDALYYKMSDKAKRKYQQTWVECPARRIKPKVVCEYPKGGYPPLERRPRKSRPDTAKCMDGKAGLMKCSRSKDTKQNKGCLKIVLPGCRSVRANIRCKLVRGPSDCKPIKNPYPSFSECTKPKLKPKRPCECACLKIRTMCEVWTILRQKTVLT